MTFMTPEERFERIERQLEFLAAGQAQHDARMAEISGQLAVNSGQIGQLSDLTLRIGRIVEEQARRMDALAESQRRTDERLNTLINVVERYFSNGHK
ncbi:MAG TPA: hypothetical protein VE398_06550 [Acidobacteriota bacterium]|nr:hypothetical protein [Acidobacteriota bacterium]